jgi:hypothetical protein
MESRASAGLRTPALTSAAVFISTALVLAWLTADRFTLSNDEGIFLEGALRILRGQVPYRDFFVLMGPGAFWLQALALKVLGISLAASRAINILDFAVIAGCVSWLLSRTTSPAFAAWVSAILIALETADPIVTLPNHRWDSAAFALLGITILTERPGRALALIAGACLTFSAWITPSMALVGLALMIQMLIERRRALFPFALGCVLVTSVCAGALQAQHALGAMLDHMLWTSRNYGSVNFMPYASRVGGYAQFWRGLSGMQLASAILVVFGLTIPAILPPAALISILAWRRRWLTGQGAVRTLIVAGIALVLATYPRMDVAHLTYSVPVFYVLAAVIAFELHHRWLPVAGILSISLLATVFVWWGVSQHFAQAILSTRVGTVRAPPDDAALINGLEEQIPQGSGFFAFPYLPVSYFITLATNPTRYSYLQPGMMSAEDEGNALNQLIANPPAKILYQDVQESEILRIWPATDPTRLRLRRIESYLLANYHVRREIPYSVGAFQIMERNGATSPESAAMNGGAIVKH